ncbi:MAG: response regulator [Candidatus Magnetomorum sp.]|nr:response regulator [Candidatus Magnetomorum sp.]
MKKIIQLSTENKKGVILIIDDNISNIKVVVKHLNEHNFETIIARNGHTGIERARFSQPDLILLDVLMPGMDGFETCRGLKSDEATRDIPVLFMTVLSEISDKVKAFKAGAVDYVTKPIQEEEILARVKTHLKLRYLQNRLEIKNETLQYQAMLMDQIKDSIISTDLNGHITYVNQSAERLLMRHRNELIGNTIHILGENLDLGASQNEIVEKTLRHGNWQGRVVNADKNGIEHIFETRTWLTYDKEGKKSGIIGVSTDITEQARMQADLKQAKEAAETASNAKTTFLANMSHELKSPLNAIIGFSHLMARDKNLSVQYRRDLDAIYRSGKHLLLLINDLLNISRIESDRVELKNNNCNIYSIINDVKGMFRLKAFEKGLQFIFDIPSDLPEFIHVDESKLRQVLINLISNAIKFTDKGSICCRLSLVTQNKEIQKNDHQCIFRFEIEDTGEGILSDEIDDLFEPFVQLSTGQKSHQGTGLGLSISRKYIQLMGGDIGVNSEPGQGSLFWFTICTRIADAENMHTEKSQKMVVSLGSDQPDDHVKALSPEKYSDQRLIAERLASLPEYMIDDLKQATSNFDVHRIYKIIEKIRKLDGGIADVLDNYIYNFEYTQLMDIL